MLIRTNFAMVVLAVLTLGLFACGDDDDDDGGDKIDAAVLIDATPQADAPPAADCTDIFNEGECGTCAETSCCDEFSVCKATENCIGCLSGQITDKAICGAPAVVAAANAAGTCLDTSCAKQCAPTSSCNPVTNAPCAAGEACDLNQDGTYVCFPPPNDALLCGACDVANPAGPFCGGGTTCVEDSCGRFCCADTDCGAAGVCDKSTLPGGVGVCVTSGTTEPVCDAPAESPSGGSCFTL